MVGSLILVGTALAANGSTDSLPVPQEVKDSTKSMCDGGAGVAQSTWLASTSSSSSTTIGMPYGAKTVTIGIYGLRYKCKSTSRTSRGDSKITNTSSSQGTSTGLKDFQYSMDYGSKAGDYTVTKVGSFTYTLTNPLMANTDVTIRIDSAGRLYGGSYGAGGGCAEVDNPTHYLWGTCESERNDVKLKFKITSGWQLAPATTINKTTASVGQKVVWTHTATETLNVDNTGATGLTYYWTKNGVPSNDLPSSTYRYTTSPDTNKLKAYSGQSPTYEGSNLGVKIKKNSSIPLNKKPNGDPFNNPTKYSWVVPDSAQPGDVYCQYMNVSPQASYSDDDKSSIPSCVTITAPPIMPMIQIKGYDGRFGSRVVTTLPQTYANGVGTTWGSWGEYGASSNKVNYNFATAAGLSGGNSSSSQSDWSQLTFANANNAACSTSTFGCYGTIAYPQLVAAAKAKCTTWMGAVGTDTPISPAPGSFTCVRGTAVINSDIADADAGGDLNHLATLSQTVIVADNIVIGKDVGQLYAWLIAANTQSGVLGNTANGNISTCSAVKRAGSYFLKFESISLAKDSGAGSLCNKQLTVTGPVVANSLYLYRTTDPGGVGNPAEIFDLRADAFLWAYNGGLSGGTTPVAQTTSIQELPPRF